MIGNQTITIKKGGNFDPIPMDRYTVEIFDVNLVKQFNTFKQEEQEMLNYQFVILEDKPMEGGSTRGRYLWRRCSLSLNQKSWLGKLVVAAYGRDLTQEETDAFNPDSILGKQVDVMVEQVEKDGNIYNNILSFSKASKTLPKWEFVKEASEEKSSKPVKDGIKDVKKMAEALGGDVAEEVADDIPF